MTLLAAADDVKSPATNAIYGMFKIFLRTIYPCPCACPGKLLAQTDWGGEWEIAALQLEIGRIYIADIELRDVQIAI